MSKTLSQLRDQVENGQPVKFHEDYGCVQAVVVEDGEGLFRAFQYLHNPEGWAWRTKKGSKSQGRMDHAEACSFLLQHEQVFGTS